VRRDIASKTDRGVPQAGHPKWAQLDRRAYRFGNGRRSIEP